MSKNVTIISKYFLPSINVDSDAVYDMVKGILDENPQLNITIVTSNIAYKGELTPNSKYSPSILQQIKIETVKPILAKRKMISDFLLGFQLVSLAKKNRNRTIISLSNPPLISLWHSLLLKGYNFYYWTFDIFPQALAADNLIKDSGFIYRILNAITYRSKPKGLISLGNCQYKFLDGLYGGVNHRILLPCGIHNEQDQVIPSWKESNKITIGYLGNIGRAHSPTFLENVLKAVANLDHIKFVISVYGFHSDRIKEFVSQMGADNISFVSSVAKGQLRFIDVHLVSLLPEWANISVPSKAVSAVCSGSALWYCGPKDVDTVGLFEKCSFISTEDFKSVTETLNSISLKSISDKKKISLRIKDDLKGLERKAYKDIVKSII